MTIRAIKEYDNYQICELSWLNKIPHHWRLERVKSLTKTQSGTTPQSGTSDYYDDGTFFWVRTTDLNNNRLYTSEFKITDLAIKHCGLKLIPPKSVLLAMYGGMGTIGKNSILEETVTINQSVCAVLPQKKKFDSIYLWYYMQYFRPHWEMFADSARKDPNINQEAIKRLWVTIPPLSEQKAIADYLDSETSHIDRKIELLTQKAIQYGKLKHSLINETVTRGLDKSVAIKNSGVEWIGEVPEHWDVKRLKELGVLYSGLSGKKGEDFTDEHEFSSNFIPFVNVANNQYISPTEMNKVIVYPNEKQNKVRKNDLFFLMSSENHDDIGKSALLEVDIVDTYLNSFCRGFRFEKKGIKPKFINYLLASVKCRNHLSVEGKGFTRINLKIEKINDLLLMIPPLPEQTAIADFLDEKTARIDRIFETINIQIDKLKELRKTLINDLVTGKIRATKEGATE
ncbi:restriction endonuclease subunit S [Paenibacillus sp. NPDC058071]|uniref:restriction endonuclease subunit S n=1 Tax=Paenibacillus sp. NPDC058071 TaxID=3346326 RepID=UPI0036DDEA74